MLMPSTATVGAIALAISIIAHLSVQSDSLLYPFETESREVRLLDGVWSFKAEHANSHGIGFTEQWYKRDLRRDNETIPMAVPSSFNDITQLTQLRDHVGWVWYQRTFYLQKFWASGRTVLRFDSIHYFAAVFVNGNNVVNHTGGHLPFEVEISDIVNYGSANILTVAVNNTLSRSTIPPGEFVYKSSVGYPPGFFESTTDFDFFNYAGIHRSVRLYSTPSFYLADVQLSTVSLVEDGSIENGAEIIFNLSVGRKPDKTGLKSIDRSINDDFEVEVRLYNAKGRLIGEVLKPEGSIAICHPQLWWPRGMNETVGYLYTVEIRITSKVTTDSTDVYRLQYGLRTISVSHNQFFINSVPFYFKGVNLHEDSEIRGKGFDWPVLLKDFNLIDWLDANAFRTSHYPYAEERLQEADRRGIVVIGETSAVGVKYFTEENLELHTNLLLEMIERDRHHASVVMWSLANEPATDQKASRAYFQQLLKTSHKADPSRPVTIVTHVGPDQDQAADLVDVICINRYYGWYHEIGRLELVCPLLKSEVAEWSRRFNKPLIISEYGAEAVAGLHSTPSVSFSEEYQTELMQNHHDVFDEMRGSEIHGEFIWNLFEFATPQSVSRVGGTNRKGIFSRNRQPKQAAFVLKKRYENIESIVRDGKC